MGSDMGILMEHIKDEKIDSLIERVAELEKEAREYKEADAAQRRCCEELVEQSKRYAEKVLGDLGLTRDMWKEGDIDE